MSLLNDLEHALAEIRGHGRTIRILANERARRELGHEARERIGSIYLYRGTGSKMNELAVFCGVAIEPMNDTFDDCEPTIKVTCKEQRQRIWTVRG